MHVRVETGLASQHLLNNTRLAAAAARPLGFSTAGLAGSLAPCRPPPCPLLPLPFPSHRLDARQPDDALRLALRSPSRARCQGFQFLYSVVEWYHETFIPMRH